MTVDEGRSRTVLFAVHRFILDILQKHLGHEIPVPEALYGVDAFGDASALTPLRRWLAVLDLAIAPPMVRDALEDETAPENAEALLRYYVMKSSLRESDRDKTDFIATFLYRNPRVQGRWELRPRASGAGSVSAFEEAVMEVLEYQVSPPMPDEHRQLLREFEAIRTEVEDFRHFDALMDSGVVQRVREKKFALGESFYHPRALATIAAYNAYFRLRFDDLFRAATQQIKLFAEQVQKQGGTIGSGVKGMPLSDAEEKKILKADYGRAQDQLRKVSQLKKALDARQRSSGGPKVVVGATAPAMPPMAATAGAGSNPQAQAQPRPQPKVVMTAPGEVHVMANPPAVAALPPEQIDRTFSTTQDAARDMLGKAVAGSHEEGKLRTMQDTVRNFVLSAEAKSAHVVPLRHGNLIVSAAEVDAFRAAYWQEQSFRGDFARALMEAVALLARVSTETADFREKQSSAYLWKPHADSLAWLIAEAPRIIENLHSVTRVAQNRGLTDKANTLASTAQRISFSVQQTAKLLQSLGSDPGQS